MMKQNKKQKKSLNKKQKNSFEQKFLSHFQEQYEQAHNAQELLSKDIYETYYNQVMDMRYLLHGNYTHHSVLVLSENAMSVIGFDKVAPSRFTESITTLTEQEISSSLLRILK